MSRKRLESFLKRHSKIGIDTSVFIYQVEANPKYLKLVDPIFTWLESRHGRAVTSTITMLEVLVVPYRIPDIDAVNKFYALLSTYPHLDWIEPTLEIADRAAQLRADLNLKTPDALQASTSLVCQATGLITNDPVFKRIGGIEALILDEMLGA